MGEAYLPILWVFLIVGAMSAGVIYLAQRLGPKKLTDAKAQPFESGIPGIEPHRGPVSVRFYLIAMIFILFDIEVIFLYPWAILFRRLGLLGFVEALIFIGILGIGLIYAWKKGALEWD